MTKATSKTVRDILIIICIIVIAVVIRDLIISQKKPKHVLATGDTEASDPHGTMDEPMMGHGSAVFPAGDDTVIATISGKIITSAMLNKEANSTMSKMGGVPEDEARLENVKEEARMLGFASILTELQLKQKAAELGIDVVKIGQEALDAWAEEAGAESPQALLDSINYPGVTLDDMAKLLTEGEINGRIQQAIAEENGLTDQAEIDAFMGQWLQDGIFSMEIEFADTQMEGAWEAFIASAAMGHGGGHGADDGHGHGGGDIPPEE